MVAGGDAASARLQGRGREVGVVGVESLALVQLRTHLVAESGGVVVSEGHVSVHVDSPLVGSERHRVRWNGFPVLESHPVLLQGHRVTAVQAGHVLELALVANVVVLG